MTEIFTDEVTETYIQNSSDVLSTIKKVEERDYYPLSNAQERLWIMENLSDSNTQYNIVDAYNLFGKLNINLLQKAVNQVIARHEPLRTYIRLVDGQPKQFILNNVNTEIDVIDLSNLKDKYQEARKNIRKDILEPFDLQNAPLLRLKLFKISNSEHILHFNFHHIISDGWSIDIFFTEVFFYYNQEDLNECCELNSLSLRYRDYVNWQLDIQKSDEFRRSENYWLKTLSGDLPKLNLKNDFSRPQYKSYCGSNYKFKLEESIVYGLKSIARKNETTLFTILMTIYNILLSYNSDEQDIIIGFPVAGRNHPDLASLIGMFVNTVVIRNNCNDSLTFQTFLQQVKNSITEALEHQNYPFENLVKKLKQKRDINRNPIFDAMLTFQNFREVSISTSIIQYKQFDIQASVAWFDIIFDCVEANGEIEIKIIFDNDLFKIETIQQLARNFIDFSRRIVALPSSSISSIKNFEITNTYKGI